MNWWMLYAYDTSNGKRAILGVINSPFKPSDRSPFYLSEPIKQKWIKAIDADISGFGFEITVRKN